MTYALSYLTLAAAFGSIVVIVPSWYVRGPALYAGGTFVLVALAYLFNWPFVLGKSGRGGRWPWGWFLTAPYLLLSEISFRLSGNAANNDRQPVPITDHVVLGPRLVPEKAEEVVKQYQVDSVLDLAAEFSARPTFRELPHYRSCPVLDASSPSIEEFTQAMTWLVDRAGKGNVYVHCALGHGRSVMAVAGYLVATKRAKNPKEAMKYVKAVRPKAKLSPQQWATLVLFSRQYSQ